MHLKFKYFVYVFLSCTICISSCNPKDNKKLNINFNKDSTAIVINIENKAAYFSLVQMQESKMPLNELVSVVELTDDLDSTSFEQEIDGKIAIMNNTVEFTPYTPFIKGKSYNISTLIDAGLGGSKELLNNSLDIKSSGMQQTLKR